MHKHCVVVSLNEQFLNLSTSLNIDYFLLFYMVLIERIYPHLVSGGTIAIDDCTYDTDGRFDGSFQAYEEFVNENNLTRKIVGNRLGIIKKP